MKLRTIDQAKNLEDKTVILRLDTDVEIKYGKITDDTRLKASLPTLDYLLKNKTNVVIIGHLGRPHGEEIYALTLTPIARWFFKRFGKGELKKLKINDFKGWHINNQIFLLENIRFFKEEEDSTSASRLVFAKKLANLGDIFVNDAFGVSHRNHASITGIPEFIPSYAGFHLEKEVETLSKIIEKPQRSLVVIIGGAKIETKLPLVEKMHHIADYVLVGGEIAEQDKILMEIQHEKVNDRRSILLVADAKKNKKDITEKSVENFSQIINISKTIVWNGTMGEINKAKINEEGTRKIAESIAKSKGFKVVGGGDTVSYLKSINLLDKFDFVSTGGGAMLELLSGKKLPGIEALKS